MFGGTALFTGILTLLTPLAARTDYRVLIALRVLIGMASGAVFPSAAVLWGKWVTKEFNELNLYLIYFFSGKDTSSRTKYYSTSSSSWCYYRYNIYYTIS
jgi:MFS family permease